MYKKMANSKLDLPPVSTQWEVLGFQGSDPRTDLNRSFGVLNVLHMLCAAGSSFRKLPRAFFHTKRNKA